MHRHRPHHLAPRLDTVRVALVYRDTGGLGLSHAGLGVSAAHTAKTLRRHGIWADCWPTSSAKHLRERLGHTHAHADYGGDLRPTHVVIAAPWLLTADVAELAMEFPDVVFAVVSHSNVGFLAADPHAIRLLRETVDRQFVVHNIIAAGNSQKFVDWATAAWGVHLAWLPNLYDLSETFPRRDAGWCGGELRLGLFGANRPLKNFLTAAAAAVELATRLRVPTELYLSSGRDEGGNIRALDELTERVPNLRVRRTGWLSWPEFRRLVRHMHLVLQPSYTESFNVVTADAIAEGVPVVASDAIDWVPEWWQACADEPRDVARVAEHLLRDPNAPHDGRAALEHFVEHGVAGWVRFLCPTLRIPPSPTAPSE
jgi:glycosyltransferase involved in cell wall biosynthesis